MKWESKRVDENEWHLWYAWRPIRVKEWSVDARFGFDIDNPANRSIHTCWTWGETVWRRAVWSGWDYRSVLPKEKWRVDDETT